MVESTAKGGFESAPDHYKEAARRLPPLAPAFNNDSFSLQTTYGPLDAPSLKTIALQLQNSGLDTMQRMGGIIPEGRNSGAKTEEERKKEQQFYHRLVLLQLAEQIRELDRKIADGKKAIRELEQEKIRLRELLEKINGHLSGRSRLEIGEDGKFKDHQVEMAVVEHEKSTGTIVDRAKPDEALKKVAEKGESQISKNEEKVKVHQEEVDEYSKKKTEVIKIQSAVKDNVLSGIALSGIDFGTLNAVKLHDADEAKLGKIADASREPTVIDKPFNKSEKSAASEIDPQRSALRASFTIAHGSAATYEEQITFEQSQGNVPVAKPPT